MPIFRRITDIISANLNELVDRFEDPPAMLRQAVREMERSVDQTMQAAARAIAHERLLERDLVQRRERVERLRELAAAALRRDDESAARHALAERARLQVLISALDDQLASAHNESEILRRQTQALRLRLAEARQMQHLYVARSRAADARRNMVRSTVPVASALGTFERFDRACEAIELREAESAAYAELAGDVLLDLPDETDQQVELELQTLRSELETTT
jgi:phage shock protein A